MDESVVIVGGGPTGMWLACELRLAGVRTVVLEQDPKIDQNSRALTLHARTIETFALRGAHQDLLAEGGRIPSGHFAVLDDRLDFRRLDTDFPYTLTVPQARTTELLQRRAVAMGADVRRGHKVTDCVDAGDTVTVSVDGPDGAYVLGAAYVVGCDGTRSVVRQCAGIEFEGTGATALGALGDVVLSDPPPGPVTSQWTTRGTFMIVPLSGGRHRIVVHSPEDLRDGRPGELTLEELRERVSRIAGTDYGMHSPSWLSRYGNTSRVARHYRKGRVLLAGDAAHQHMPMGGVGLNVGVQDAMNLGWKLAATVSGRASEELLDTYHQERHPVGEDTIEHTQAQTAIMSAFSPQGTALRSLLGKLIAEQPQLNDALAQRLSGLSVTYSLPGRRHPLTGHRAPNLRLSDTEHLFDLLQGGRPVLIDFARVDGFGVDGLSSDDASARLDRYRCPRPVEQSRAAWAGVSAALIRPDGYVGWASDETAAAALAAEAGNAVAALHHPRPENPQPQNPQPENPRLGVPQPERKHA
ncbi:FAD-dependent monooxygenase [Streptomyces luomodiensis]|uniref:FAD-dependent monooxygenase n=1 Tax=Streptomyces luomodiensis TaxID=3026192 RepID=A0ABY9UVE2_9ACTN|nr:FAD-dependent monooxygenase [Streptomyces sp. SCA4-21]WNE95433.1 FAD-dependent monooxygenase [Streptomyces sp. SCA4-21]